jgi:hypothetical protein
MEENDKIREEPSAETTKTADQAHGIAQDIKFAGDELESRLTDDQRSIGLDLDGTNPGSRSHPLDYDTLDEK